MQGQYVDVKQNINDGKYKNKMPYKSIREDKDAYIAYENEESRIYDQFKQDLFDQDNVSGPSAEKCFSLAWEHGHSAGYNEVLIYWNEFVELIKDDKTIAISKVKYEALLEDQKKLRTLESNILDYKGIRIKNNIEISRNKVSDNPIVKIYENEQEIANYNLSGEDRLEQITQFKNKVFELCLEVIHNIISK